MDLSVFGNDAHVGCGVTQGEAAGLGEHDGIGVAHAGAFEVENLTVEGDMRPLRQEFGVEDEAVVAHAALVEDFGVENEEATEFGAYLGEVDTPLDEIFVGRDDLVHGGLELGRGDVAPLFAPPKRKPLHRICFAANLMKRFTFIIRLCLILFLL